MYQTLGGALVTRTRKNGRNHRTANRPRPRPPGARSRTATADRPVARAATGTQPPRARRRLERVSTPLLIRLHTVPRWLLGVVLGLLLLAGLGFTGPLSWLGGVCILLIVAFVAWLSALAWPVLTGGSRVARVIVVAAILGIGVLKFTGRF